MVWVVLIPIALLSLFGLGIRFADPYLSCLMAFSNENIYYIFYLIVMAVIPIIVLVVFDVWVVVIVQKNLRIVYSLKMMQQGENEAKPGSIDNQLYKTVKKKRSKKQLHLIQVFGALLGSSLRQS